jgi:hypothetical protein
MSVARTAARRRRQYKLGFKGLANIYGANAAPKYPGVVSKEKSAKKGEARRQAMARGAKF